LAHRWRAATFRWYSYRGQCNCASRSKRKYDPRTGLSV